jgi:ATP-dependent helicase/nuclease subunit A
LNLFGSTPFPEKWLEEKVEEFNIEEKSFEKTPWGEILFKKAKNELENVIIRLKKELEDIRYEEDIEKVVVILSEDIRKITNVYEKNNWDEMYEELRLLKLDTFRCDKNLVPEIKDKIKKKRDNEKACLKDISSKILISSSSEACKDIKNMYEILLKIKDIILEFSKRFSKIKQDRNIMDFTDIEHFALEILTKEEEGENHICKKYKEKFEEILIDEYQDSNLVQESILTRVSRDNNIFMVGDVKQSIYKFRQARPELFLEKYESYKQKDELKEGENLKIQLFMNFRSRKNILDITNYIFDTIMTKELGDIDYTEEEYLNLGAKYEETDELKIETHIIDLKEEEESIYKSDEKKEEKIDEKIEDAILEAKFVANKIKELMDKKYVVSNKDGSLRNIKYKDIAVILRSTKTLAPIYEQEIAKLNMPVFCDTSSRIFRFS